MATSIPRIVEPAGIVVPLPTIDPRLQAVNTAISNSPAKMARMTAEDYKMITGLHKITWKYTPDEEGLIVALYNKIMAP